jgi:L-glutamine-phosphate cytidylyltransferase
LRALRKFDEDILWLNGDIVFHSSILAELFKHPKTGMLVSVGAVGEEEVKYTQDSDGRILSVSKSVFPSNGEALGINYCTRKDLNAFRRNLMKCTAQDYFEKAIEMCIEEGTAVWSIPVDSRLCTEVDFSEDLERANALIVEWESRK